MKKIPGQAAGHGMPATACKYNVSEQTLYVWRRRFDRDGSPPGGGAQAPAAGERAAEEAGGRAGSRARGREGNHGEKTLSVPARRECVRHAEPSGISQVQACRIFRIVRSLLSKINPTLGLSGWIE